MASKVKLPLLGSANKGTVVGVTIGGVTLAAYMIYRRNKKNVGLQASTAQAQAASAYGYGMAQSYGYGSLSDMSGYYGYGAGGGFAPTGYYGYGVPNPPGGGGSPTAFPMTTNAQWDQAAQSQLTAEGFDSKTVADALGAYLHGSQVDASQVGIVQNAIGVEGYPPEPGTNGFPPSINSGGTPGGGGGGGQGGGTTSVPDVVGMRVNAAEMKLKAAGFKARTSPARNPLKTYTVTAENPSGQAAPGTLITLSIKEGK